MRIKAAPIGHQTHSFQTYPSSMISRSRFDRSNSLLTSLNAGYLIPIYVDEALPGDTIDISVRAFARLATQIVPFMDNLYMDVHFWDVPNRLLYDYWEELNGEQRSPGASTDYLVPQITAPSTGVTTGSIYDYFGIPIKVGNLAFSALPFRAYNKVYNEWYRDENLIEPVTEVDGETDSFDNYKLLKRGKRKDYFTGSLPWPQKGPGVELPLGGTAPLNAALSWSPNAILSKNGVSGNLCVPLFQVYGKSTEPTALNLSIDNISNPNSAWSSDLSGTVLSNGASIYSGEVWGGANTSDQGIAAWHSNGLTPQQSLGLGVSGTADLSSATAATINSLRQAFALQRMYETDARGGTRYIEMIKAHFGVTSPDARLQRPEFLGGATFNLNLGVVPQTSSSDSTSPQGNLSSYGTIQGESRRIIHSFTEHSTVIGLVSIRGDYTYQQGLERMWSRRARTDFYLPTLANLGEQAILNKEIYAQGTSEDDDVFGYQERWAEYRYKQNHITGQLRSTADQSLEIWHLAQNFSNLPKLNESFITENPPVDRVIAISESDNTPQFIANFFFKEYWTRPMPVYSIPSMKSHF